MRHGLDDTEESLSEQVARYDALERVVPDDMREKIAESLSRGRQAQARADAEVLKAALAQRGETVTVDELLTEIGGTAARESEPENTPNAAPEGRSDSPPGAPKRHWWKDPKWIITTLIGAGSLIATLLAL